MKKLPQIFAVSLLGLLAFSASTAQAQTKLPPWIKTTETPAPQPAPTSQPSQTPTTVPDERRREEETRRNEQIHREEQIRREEQARRENEARRQGGARPDIVNDPSRSSDYSDHRSRKGHPHGMPPGQAKKRGYYANPSNGGLPPGQAKKVYRGPAAVPGTVYTKEEKHEGKHKHKGHKKHK